MKHLTILIPEGKINLSSIIGTYHIFTRANEYWRNLGREAIFKIELAGISKEVQLHDGIFAIRPHVNIKEIKKTDLVIIPALHGDFSKVVKQNSSFTEWIREQYKQGAEIASICTGAFLLASTGLIEGRNCSTHWNATEAFRKMFSNVKLIPGKLITDEQGIYTNGGAFSFLNLLLYLMEKYYDRQTAIYCSKIFQIEIDRDNQSQFTIFAGQKNHEDDVIKKAQIEIEEKIQEKISINQLSDKFCISRRNFDRRFIKATGNTPLEYVQRVKIEAAKKSLETTRKTINEVMFDVGYADVKAFREVFRKVTGLTPLEYKNKYNKERMAS